MENIFNPIYRHDYTLGYSDGQNPFIQTIDETLHNPAFNSGFRYGRNDYERLNGPLSNGIPNQIVTIKLLEDFLLAGMLGIDIQAEGYTLHQMDHIEKWYESGIEKYDPN